MGIYSVIGGDENDYTPITRAELVFAVTEMKLALTTTTDKDWINYYQCLLKKYSDKLTALDKATGVKNCGGIGNYDAKKDK